MSRTVKTPEDRKNELMMAAAELFISNGYEETSVNSIIEKIGVAKGTFYHYYKSKEDILEAILTMSMEQFSEELIALSENSKLSAWEKLQHILSGITMPPQVENKLSIHIKDSKDDKIHMALENKFFQVFYPIILRVVKEGIQNKEFSIKYPEEITEVVTLGVQGFMHNHISKINDFQYAEVKMKALEELFSKVLSDGEKEFKFLFNKE